MYTLLIPKQQSFKETKIGRGNPFWASFWEKKISENPKYYKNQYGQRLARLRLVANSFSKQFKEADKKYYLEAKLDELANTKSKEPTEIWKESGLQIVESREDGTLTLSGSGNDLKKLARILNSADFNIASETEHVKKINNLSREVFSVTALSDKNASPEKRVSEDIKLFMSNPGNDRIDCVLTVYFDRPFNEYDDLYEILISKIDEGKIEKIDTEFFINNMVFKAYLSANEIRKILLDIDCNFINYIKTVSSYSAQRTTPNIDSKSMNIGSVLTNETVVIIDSGIEHQALNNFVAQRENFLDSSKGHISSKDHGTAVGSRVLFGDNFFQRAENGEVINPAAKIIDIQVLHKNGNNINTDYLTLNKAIKRSVTRYCEQANIYNLSVSDENGVEDHDISETSELIDYLSNKHDVLFICAAGNHNSNFPLGYENIFNTPGVDCHIAAPSDALNALSVGSITDLADSQCLCVKKSYPSPFTRKGGIRNDIKKPELVAVGGNVKVDHSGNYDSAHLDISKNTYGVQLMNTNGFIRDVGTSFSAPLITRQSVQLLDYIKKSSLPSQLGGFIGNRANLVKALMIHSASRVEQSDISNDGLKRAYGFGQPEFSKVLVDDENQVTIVYADKVNAKEKKQKILINLPNYLLGKKVDFTFTFVYNPPVNRNFKEYKMIDLKPSIGFLVPEFDNGKPTGKIKIIGNNPKHSWESYRSSYFNTVHFTKNRSKLTQLDLQVLIQMTVSNRLLEEYAGREDEINQNYAMVLTIRDKSESNKLRKEILNSNQFFELIENDIQVQATV